MIPIAEVSGGTLDAVFVYTGILGLLLLAGVLLRSKIPVFKRLFIPASLIAGVLGLLLGPHMLGVIPPQITAYWSALSGRLIVIVFAPMLMGSQMKMGKIIRSAGPSIAWSYLATFVQYAFPLLLCAFVLTPLMGVNGLFGTIVEQGWAGGHGTAGGFGPIFEELGYAEGGSLSVTSATVGLLFGVIGGTAMINYAVSKKYTTVLTAESRLNGGKPDFIPASERKSGCSITVSSDMIESFAFHGALIGVAILIGYILNAQFKVLTGLTLSWFVTSMIGGLLVQLVIGRTKWAEQIDKPTFSRIQGIALEFLVAGAVASVNIPVVLEYAVPLILQQGMMMLVMIFLVFWLSPRVFPDHWFEHSMVLLGTYTGVVATGMMLLRTCDPEMKTGVSEVFAARAPLCGPMLGGGLLTALAPTMVAQYGALTVGGIYLAATVAVLILMRVCGWWHAPLGASKQLAGSKA